MRGEGGGAKQIHHKIYGLFNLIWSSNNFFYYVYSLIIATLQVKAKITLTQSFYLPELGLSSPTFF
jgi:hypothetical protein